MRSKGLTLIELLVVVAILGLLFTLALPAFNKARADARDAKRVGDLWQLRLAIELYYGKYGYYPGRGGNWVSDLGEYVGDPAGNFEDEIKDLIIAPADPLHDEVKYYYSYDPCHSDISGLVDGKGSTLCFHSSETGKYTCQNDNPVCNSTETDMNQHQAAYCIVFDEGC